jgi:putative (di)nucleoside polyphosphate hydrolase
MSYRPAVAAIIQDPAGRILVCERSDVVGAWQFPQGGIDPNESGVEALARELLEELCLSPDAYEVIESKGPYRYQFPAGQTKRGFRGQAHHYFRVRLLRANTLMNVNSAHPEFRAIRWIEPADFELAWLPPMKRAAYRRVFQDFFAVKLRR